LHFNILKQINHGFYKAVIQNKIGKCETILSLLEIESKPIIKPYFEDDNIQQNSCERLCEEKKEVEFKFFINGFPEPIIECYKENTKIKNNEKKIGILKKEEIITFFINDLNINDAGEYRIYAKNSIGESSYLISLKIKSIPKLLKGLKNKIDCIENTDLELNCTVSSVYPQVQFNWLKNDQILDFNEIANIKVFNENNSSKLLIEKIDLSLDLSKFKFFASNDLGSCECEASIEVFVIPKFTLQLNDSQPQLNQPFEWNFVIDSHPEPKLKFFKNDKELNLSKETRIRLNKEFESQNFRKIYKYKLNFANIIPDDLGTYRIDATNKVGESKNQANLTVIGSPCFIKKPMDTNIVLGKPFKVEFEIAGIPVPEVLIYKNGEILIFDDKIKLESKNNLNYLLTTKNCTIQYSGIYRCKISNSIGFAEEEFRISILGSVLNFFTYILK
jgi:hypothetical protein